MATLGNAPTFQHTHIRVTPNPLKTRPEGGGATERQERKGPSPFQAAGNYGNGGDSAPRRKGGTCRVHAGRASAVRAAAPPPAPAWVESRRPFSGPHSPTPGSPASFTLNRRVAGGCPLSVHSAGRSLHLPRSLSARLPQCLCLWGEVYQSSDKRVPAKERETHRDFRGPQRYWGASTAVCGFCLHAHVGRTHS